MRRRVEQHVRREEVVGARAEAQGRRGLTCKQLAPLQRVDRGVHAGGQRRRSRGQREWGSGVVGDAGNEVGCQVVTVLRRPVVEAAQLPILSLSESEPAGALQAQNVPGVNRAKREGDLEAVRVDVAEHGEAARAQAQERRTAHAARAPKIHTRPCEPRSLGRVVARDAGRSGPAHRCFGRHCKRQLERLNAYACDDRVAARATGRGNDSGSGWRGARGLNSGRSSRGWRRCVGQLLRQLCRAALHGLLCRRRLFSPRRRERNEEARLEGRQDEVQGVDVDVRAEAGEAPLARRLALRDFDLDRRRLKQPGALAAELETRPHVAPPERRAAQQQRAKTSDAEADQVVPHRRAGLVGRRRAPCAASRRQRHVADGEHDDVRLVRPRVAREDEAR